MPHMSPNVAVLWLDPKVEESRDGGEGRTSPSIQSMSGRASTQDPDHLGPGKLGMARPSHPPPKVRWDRFLVTFPPQVPERSVGKPVPPLCQRHPGLPGRVAIAEIRARDRQRLAWVRPSWFRVQALVNPQAWSKDQGTATIQCAHRGKSHVRRLGPPVTELLRPCPNRQAPGPCPVCRPVVKIGLRGSW